MFAWVVLLIYSSSGFIFLSQVAGKLLNSYTYYYYCYYYHCYYYYLYYYLEFRFYLNLCCFT